MSHPGSPFAFSHSMFGKFDFLLKQPSEYVAFGVPLDIMGWDSRQPLIDALIHGAENAVVFSPEVRKEIAELSGKAAADAAAGRRMNPSAAVAWIEAIQVLGQRALHSEMMIQLLSMDAPNLEKAFAMERKRIEILGNGKRVRLSPQGRQFASAVDSLVFSRAGVDKSRELRKDTKALKIAREQAVRHLELRLTEKARQFGVSTVAKRSLLREYRRMRDTSIRHLRELVPSNVPKKWNLYDQTLSGVRQLQSLSKSQTTFEKARELLKGQIWKLVDPEPCFEYRCVKDEQGGLVLTRDGKPIFRKIPTPTWADLLPMIGESALKYEFAPAMMLEAMGKLCHALAIKTGRVAASDEALAIQDMVKASVAGDLSRPQGKLSSKWEQDHNVERN